MHKLNAVFAISLLYSRDQKYGMHGLKDVICLHVTMKIISTIPKAKVFFRLQTQQKNV
jgi:hypothetical protein